MHYSKQRDEEQMSDLGQEYALSAPLNRVWNAPINRRSGSAVGKPFPT